MIENDCSGWFRIVWVGTVLYRIVPPAGRDCSELGSGIDNL